MRKKIEKNKRIAIISDIHANYSALKAVMADIESKHIDTIYCLGDLVCKGVHPNECIELVREKCQVVLLGNGDDRFSDDAEKFVDNKVEYERIIYNQKLIDKKYMKYLHNLPLNYEFYMSGNLVRLFHATADDPYALVLSYEKDIRKKFDLFLPTSHTSDKIADIVIYGHIHYQYMDKLYGRTLVNCGSVGNSGCAVMHDKYDKYGEITNAHYLIITGNLNDKKQGQISFDFVSVPYDKEPELQKDRELGNLIDGFERLIKKGYYLGLPGIMKMITDEGFILLDDDADGKDKSTDKHKK